MEGQIHRKIYYENGKQQSFRDKDGMVMPSHIKYNDGLVVCREYHYNDEPYSFIDDENLRPACIEYLGDKNETVYKEPFFTTANIHCSKTNLSGIIM